MKVIFVNSFYFPQEVGGAERSIKFLAEGLVKSGHQAVVLTTGEQDEEVELNGVKVIRRRNRNFSSRFPLFLKDRAWHVADTWNRDASADAAVKISELAPDLVHTNNLSGFSVALWKSISAQKIPIIHTLRDYYLICPNTALFRNGVPCKEERCRSCRILAYPRIEATHYVDLVVGNSSFILSKHLDNGAFKNSEKSVIYNAYKPASPGRVRVLEEHRDPIKIGYIGRLAPTKGVDLLIAQFKKLCTQQMSRCYELVIAGSGDDEYTRSLKSISVDFPIRFIGNVEPALFYEAIDLVVVPSKWDEPLARVIFESFAHGVPVIASSKGGSPEVVTHGKTGWLFDIEAEDALLTLMGNATTSKYEYERVSESVLKSSKEFLPEAVLKNYINAYEKVRKTD